MGFWGKAAKILDVATDVLGATGIPPLMAIDSAKEAIKGIVGKSASDRENLAEAEAAITVATAGMTKLQTENAELISKVAELAGQLHTVKLQPKGRIEYKRLKTAVVSGLSVLAIYMGFPEEMADQLAIVVSGIAGTYILGDSFRPSV